MSDQNFNKTVESLFNSMDGFMSSKTVVGEPITVNDTIILPLVDVSFGVGAGAWSRENKDSAAGGIGGKMSPGAVLVIRDDSVRMIPVHSSDPVAKIIDMVPDIIRQFRKKTEEDKEVEETVENIIDPKKNGDN